MLFEIIDLMTKEKLENQVMQFIPGL